MPKDFDQCQAEGGNITTKRLNEKEYMHICWSKDGKSHAGDVKTYKKLKK